jgi:uncharacterized membrane protein
MSDLVVVSFKGDTSRALNVLDQLRQLETRWVIDFEYALAVHREADGTLHVQEGDELAKDVGMARGAFWGAIAGMVLAIPFVTVHPSMVGAAIIAGGALSGIALGATIAAVGADSWRNLTRTDKAIVRDLGALARPGDSVLGALIETSDPAAVQALFTAFEGTVLESPLPAAKAVELERYLRDRSAHVHKKAA